MMPVLIFLISISSKYEVTFDTTSVVLECKRIDFLDYVPLKAICDICNINYIFDSKKFQFLLFTPEHRMVLIPEVNVIQSDSLYQNLPFSPRLFGDDIHFPVQFITPILGSAFERLIFIREIKEVPKIDKISIFPKGDSTVLKFNWREPIEFDIQFTPNKAVLEIDGQYEKKARLKPAGQAKSVKILPYNTYTRVEIELGDVNSYQAREDEVIFFKKITTKVSLIVIDPGHGGIDPGAVGKGGLYEKDVNLEISLILKKLIEDSLKIKVLLTRERDVYLSLRSRTNFANRQNADLFISIHCNASPKNRNARGFETYFLSEAKTNEARAVESMENAALMFDEEFEQKDEISFILYDLAQSAFLEESNSLAECIQGSAEKALSIPARGVSQAGFYVLRGAFMPAILVECAFISNPEEEKLLRKKKVKQELAHAIFCGIREYISGYERRLSN